MKPTHFFTFQTKLKHREHYVAAAQKSIFISLTFWSFLLANKFVFLSISKIPSNGRLFDLAKSCLEWEKSIFIYRSNFPSISSSTFVPLSSIISAAFDENWNWKTIKGKRKMILIFSWVSFVLLGLTTHFSKTNFFFQLKHYLELKYSEIAQFSFLFIIF